MQRENKNKILTGYLTGEKIDEKEGFVCMINGSVFDKNQGIELKSGAILTVQPNGYFELNCEDMRSGISEEKVTYVVSDHDENKMHGTLIFKYDELANAPTDFGTTGSDAKPKSPRNK